MKIITRLQQHIHQFLVTPNSYSFSNLINPNSIELEQLFSKNHKKQNTQIRRISKTAINNNFNHQKSSASLGSSQNDLFKQYPGLKHIQKSINKMSMSESVKTVGFKYDELDFEVRNNNSINFMKLLDHSLSKEGCEQIIRTVEAFCDQSRQQQQQKLTLSSYFSKTSETSLSKSQQKLFQKLRLILQKHLILNQQNAKQNSQYIECLIEQITKINPFTLTLENFEQQHISLEHQIQDNRSYQRRLCGIEFMLKKEVAEQQIPPEIQDKKQAEFKDRLHFSLEEALRLRESEKKSKILIQKTGGTNLKEYKIKVAPENLLFKAKQIYEEEKQIKISQSQKYAYCYELPYNVTMDECEQFIKFIEKTYSVKVTSYALSPYNKFLENNFQDVMFSIPQNYKQRVPLDKVYSNINIDSLTVPQKKKVAVKKGRNKQDFNGIPLDFQPKALKSVTETLLNKIKRQTYSKFNKSTLVLEFATVEEKRKLTTTSLRLYGLNFKTFKNIKFEEGFSKKVVVVSGIGAGCLSNEIQLALNNALQCIDITVPPVEVCHLTKSYVFLEFQNFFDAFMAVPQLNRIIFQDKLLKAQLHYGPSKVFKNEYSSLSEDSYDLLKRKILETSNKYHLKYLDIQNNKG